METVPVNWKKIFKTLRKKRNEELLEYSFGKSDDR